MSLSQYQTLKICDKNYSLELSIDSHNPKKMKCSLRFYKQVTVDGYGQLTIYPKFVIDTTDDAIVSDVDITYKVEEHPAEVIVEPSDDVVELPSDVVAELPKDVVELPSDVVAELPSDVLPSDVVAELPKDVVELPSDVAELPKDHAGEVDDFEVEDKFLEDDRWVESDREDLLVIEEIKIRENKRVEDLLLLFNKQMEVLMEKLDDMKSKSEEEIEPQPPSPQPPSPHPPAPHPPKAHPPSPHPPKAHPPSPHPPKAHPPAPHPPKAHPPAPHPPKAHPPAPHPPARQHHAPKIEIVEQETIHSSESPLNSQISKLQKLYTNTNIDKNIVKVIIEHMKCIEHFNLSGVEKKTIVLNSIETILINNSIKDYTFILDLSSQLIDTFIAFDKDKIHIIEKKPSTLSCFPRK